MHRIIVEYRTRNGDIGPFHPDVSISVQKIGSITSLKFDSLTVTAVNRLVLNLRQLSSTNSDRRANLTSGGMSNSNIRFTTLDAVLGSNIDNPFRNPAFDNTGNEDY